MEYRTKLKWNSRWTRVNSRNWKIRKVFIMVCRTKWTGC